MASIQKRGDSWFAQVAKRGVRKSKSFGTRTEAEVWAARVEAEIGSTAPVPVPVALVEPEPVRDNLSRTNPHDGEATVADLIRRYQRELKPRKRWGNNKEKVLERLILRLGHLRLSEVSSDTLVEYAQRRAGGGVCPATVEHDIIYLGGVLRVARAVWKYPVPSEVIPDAREAMRLLGLVSAPGKRSRVATDAELKAVKAAWRSAIPVSIVDFAVLSAMRMGEILRITRSDRDGLKILVRQRKHPTLKAQNDQWVPLLNGAGKLLDALPMSGERYFPFNEARVSRAWQRAAQSAGIADLRFHDLRHTALTRLRKQGLGIPELAVVSGHRDWKMLQRYVNLTADDLLVQVGIAAE